MLRRFGEFKPFARERGLPQERDSSGDAGNERCWSPLGMVKANSSHQG
jgi:hypothetical protein